MTLITALELASNYPDNIDISASEQDNGKYAGFIHMNRDGAIHKLMISTTPIFDDEQSAIDNLHELAKTCVNEYGGT